MRKLLPLLLLLATPVLAQNNREVITPENAHRLEVVGVAGLGLITELAWQGDDALLVDSSTGRWLFDLNHVSQMPTRIAAQVIPPFQAVVEGSTVRVIDTTTQTERVSLEHPANVSDSSVRFSPNYQYLITVDAQNVIRLWNTQTGELMQVLPAFGQFTSDSRYLLYSTNATPYGGNLHIVEVSTMREVATVEINQQRFFPLASATISQDEQWLVITGGCVMICSGASDPILWDLRTGTMIATLMNNLELWSVAFSPSGDYLAGGNARGELRIWDTVSWQSRVIVPAQPLISNISFSTLASSIYYQDPCNVYRWDYAANHSPVIEQALYPYCGSLPFANLGPLTAFLIADRNSTALAVYNDQQLLWSVADVQGDHLSFSPDGSMIAISGDLPQLFDAITGEVRVALSAYQIEQGFAFSGVSAFSPDGRYWVVAPYGDPSGVVLAMRAPLTVYDTSTWEIAFEHQAHDDPGRAIYSAESIAFSPDGRLMALASPQGISLWSTSDWSVLTNVDHVWEAGGLSVAFSPDGTLLAVGGSTAFEDYPTQNVVRLYAIP